MRNIEMTESEMQKELVDYCLSNPNACWNEIYTWMVVQSWCELEKHKADLCILRSQCGYDCDDVCPYSVEFCV